MKVCCHELGEGTYKCTYSGQTKINCFSSPHKTISVTFDLSDAVSLFVLHTKSYYFQPIATSDNPGIQYL